MSHSAPGTKADMKLFWACFIALVATSFVFGVRSTLIGDIATEFNLSQGDKGRILGVGLWPFALSIIVFSLIIDHIGYKVAALFAIIGHFLAIGMTLLAKPDNDLLYWGTFTVAIANGTVEALINPVVATVFNKNKAKWLNILHAGWPAGIALGSIFTMALGSMSWQMKFGMCFIPVIIYTLLILPRKFPVNERVAAGVSYREMLAEFGAFGFLMFTALLVMAIYQAGGSAANWTLVFSAAAVVAIVAGIYTRSLGRPMFVLILITMPFLATTELGTDTWMPDLLSIELGKAAAWILVYTSVIMTILRSVAGPSSTASPPSACWSSAPSSPSSACCSFRGPQAGPSSQWPPSTPLARPSSGPPLSAWFPSSSHEAEHSP